jgi:serine/threonine-protein kinase
MNSPLGKHSETSEPVAPDDIRAELQRIISSPWFSSAPRLIRFLQFAVDCYLNNSTDQLKESILGRVVFDRGPSFDSQTDSIVRVDSQRLRRKLAEYYRNEGHADPVSIAFHAGSYVPHISYVEVVPRPQTSTNGANTPALSPQVVAVLPFDNLRPDWEEDFFCEGITDDIIHALSAIPGLRVIGRTSAFSLRHTTVDVREAGRRVGAGTIVDGSVRRQGADIRVFAEILDAETGYVRWTETYDRTLGDIFKIQAEIAAAVARVLQMTLAPVVSRRLIRSAPSMDAYMLYLKGRHAWNRMNNHGYGEAVDIFEQCTNLYPTYAAPFAGLADAYAYMALWGGLRPREAFQKAEKAAAEALKLDPLLAQGYSASAAVTAFYHWKWPEGTALARKATEINPSFGFGRHVLGWCYLATGRGDEAIDCFETALSLDPLSVRAHRTLGWGLYLRRRFAGAEKWLQAALEIHQEPAQTKYMLGQVLIAQQRYADALAIAEQSQSEPPDPLCLGLLGACYGCLGRESDAVDVEKELKAMQETGFVDPIAIAFIQLSLKQPDMALESMENWVDERLPMATLMDIDPAFDSIRDDPRFRKLVSRIHP